MAFVSPRGPAEMRMEMAMGAKPGAKEVVRALLERLPDDCSLDEIIDRLYEIETAVDELPGESPLTEAQRAEVDRRLEACEREPGRTVPWSEVRLELERDE